MSKTKAFKEITRRISGLLIVMTLVAAGFFLRDALRSNEAGAADAPAGETIIATRTQEEAHTIEVYRRVNESVVFITTTTLTVDPFDLLMEVRPKEGTGSGVIVDASRGIVLTNLHVIQDAHKIEITLADNRTYKAKLIGFDDEYDIAVLQLSDPPKHLVAAPFGDSAHAEVGQRVLAIGNPFGLNRTLTAGIISSLDRTVKSPSGKLLRGLLQTDAAINPGNSGGPLLDADGRLLGINTAILSQSGDSAGIGFAVPINQIKRVLPELIATGKVLRPKVGWILVDTTQGPMVQRILKDGPADLAGVEPVERVVDNAFVRGFIRDYENADLIYMVNGKRVRTRDEVDDIIQQSSSENPPRFTLRRGGINGEQREVVIKPMLR